MSVDGEGESATVLREVEEERVEMCEADWLLFLASIALDSVTKAEADADASGALSPAFSFSCSSSPPLLFLSLCFAPSVSICASLCLPEDDLLFLFFVCSLFSWPLSFLSPFSFSPSSFSLVSFPFPSSLCIRFFSLALLLFLSFSLSFLSSSSEKRTLTLAWSCDARWVT